MIVNMTAAHGGNTLDPLDAVVMSQGQCEFNFLKRKLAADEHNLAHQQQINNENANGNGNPAATAAYQGSIHNVWKKRHVDTAEDGAAENHNVDVTPSTNNNCYSGIGNFATAFTTTAHTDPVVTSTNTSSHQNGGDMTFNLIGSSSFINDLFAYEANLIVPVAASLVSNSAACLTEPTAFATPTTNGICDSAGSSMYDDGSNWQATDLLELDHRYNSGLQTEITQLNPTVSLKSAEDATAMETLQQQQQQQQLSPQQQSHSQQQQSPSSQTDFLVPQQKQVARPAAQTTSLIKYRQHNVLQPSSQAADADSDFEDKNLSWLLNFKFDELPHLSPDVGAGAASSANSSHGAATYSAASPLSSNKSNSPSPSSSSSSAANSALLASQSQERSRSPKTSTKAGKKFEELVMEVVTSELDGNDMIVAEHVIIEDSSLKAPKKPPFTYTELIEYALEDKGELTVSGIYQWISDRFPYYKSNDDRWKNSVRHNLSINPHLRKGAKAPQGAGHLWTISSGDSAENVLAWEHKKQRLDLFFKMESMNRERMQQHQQHLLQQQQQQQHQQHQLNHQHQLQQQSQHEQHCTSPHQGCQQEQCIYDEAAVAAAAITQEMLQHATSGGENCASHVEHQCLGSAHPVALQHELPFNDLMSDEELRKTAGQILNGIHREVEVQSVNSIISTYHDVLLDNEDYLNPIHKDVAVNESGLRNTTNTAAHAHHSSSNCGSQYYVTEIDPMELGIHMTQRGVAEEEEVLFNDEFNLNYFSYNVGSDIVA